jgi:hypothetical protein
MSRVALIPDDEFPDCKVEVLVPESGVCVSSNCTDPSCIFLTWKVGRKTVLAEYCNKCGYDKFKSLNGHPTCRHITFEEFVVRQVMDS